MVRIQNQIGLSHCSAEGASKMRHLSATVLTSQNERFLYIFSQKIIFLKIRRALFELCRFVTIVYKRQFRGFPTLQLWTFWLQKKILLRIIENLSNFYHGIFFVNLLEKYVIRVNRVILVI